MAKLAVCRPQGVRRSCVFLLRRNTGQRTRQQMRQADNARTVNKCWLYQQQRPVSGPSPAGRVSAVESPRHTSSQKQPPPGSKSPRSLDQASVRLWTQDVATKWQPDNAHTVNNCRLYQQQKQVAKRRTCRPCVCCREPQTYVQSATASTWQQIAAIA
jgi:hypothetical protein